MAKIRRCKGQMVLLVMVGVLGLGTLIIQKYVYSFLRSKQTVQETVRRKVQSLREEGFLLHKSSSDSSNSSNKVSSGSKVVLMHSFPYWYNLKSGHEPFASCNHSCILTQEPELVQEVDGVLVYSHHFKSAIPATRSPHQIWVYFSVESPFHSYDEMFSKPVWHHYFNWTMTYRRDSDFYFGYGDFVKLPTTTPKKTFSSLVKSKSKMVAWFVSNCHTQSKREDYAAALKEFIDVDIYGKCGNLKCGKEGNQSCMDMLSQDYHFYLSFENSLCKDYATEKIYRTMKRVDIVPVVRGGSNYSALLPKNSFIDASQFPSVKALAEHLKQVAADKKKYEQYLQWKNEWQVIEPVPFDFCKLCYRLHYPERWARVYPDVESWWHHDMCHEPSSIIRS